MYPELLVPCICMTLLLPQRPHPDQSAIARFDLGTLSQVAQHHVVEHPTEPCPTVQSLVDAGDLVAMNDPWNHPYRVECSDDAVQTRSLGEDGKLGTADDIVIPQAP